MRIAALLMLASTGCSEQPPPRKDCGIAPTGFFSWREQMAFSRPIVSPAVNTIRIDRAGDIYWNNVMLDGSIDRSATDVLDQYLRSAAGMMPPRPLTTVTFERGTSCRRINAVRELMERHLHCSQETGCMQGAAPNWTVAG